MMASFRLGPLRSPHRVRQCNPLTSPLSIDSSELQDSLEAEQHSPTHSQTNRSSGKSSPSRGRCVKEYEEQLQQLQHENFNLKLHVFLLEERVGKALGRGDAADIMKNNIELKVENETLKKSLASKNELLTQASRAIEELELQQKAAQAAYVNDKKRLNQQLNQLQKELADAEEAAGQLNAQQRADALPDESTDLYAQAFGSFVLNPLQADVAASAAAAAAELEAEQVKQLMKRIDELNRQAVDQNTVVDTLTNEINQLQNRAGEYQQTIDSLQIEMKCREQHDEDRGKQLLQLEEQHSVAAMEQQRRVEELQRTLNQRDGRIDEVEKSLTKVGRTLQGFAADSAKKEKEKHLLEHDIKRKERRIKDLTDELNRIKSKKSQNSILQQDSDRLPALFHNLNVKDNQTEPLSHLTGGGDNVYKKEVVMLRHRLADSMVANDLLRTRLEEMADFLEEVLSMSQTSLMNLSNWSAHKRHALQRSILQSRELSRSLSQSIMTSVDVNDTCSSTSSSNSSVVGVADNNNSHVQAETVTPAKIPELAPEVAGVPSVSHIDRLIFSMDSFMASREAEDPRDSAKAVVAKSLMEADKFEQLSFHARANPSGADANTTAVNQHRCPPVSSTPYHPKSEMKSAGSLISPVTNCNTTRVVREDSVKKADADCPASESEDWSEPDRSVSLARIGLPVSDNNSIGSLLLKKSSGTAHSDSDTDALPGGVLPRIAIRDNAESSVSPGGCVSGGKRSRFDGQELKRTLKRVRSLERENHSLRSQLAQVIDNLRSTWHDQQLRGDPMMDDSAEKEETLAFGDSVPSDRSDVSTAQHIMDALQNRLSKMKELLKRREQRLRETKDQVTQLEFKVKEKHFQSRQDQLQLKETQDQLKEQRQETELLHGRLVQLSAELQSLAAEKESVHAELESVRIKVHVWEKSYNDSQQSMRQTVSDMNQQQEQLVQSKALLERQVQLLNQDLCAVRDKVAKMEHNELCQAELKRCQSGSQSTGESSSKSGRYQRQLSQMSDYVSDQYFESGQDRKSAVGVKSSDNHSTSRSSTSMHHSPDLGIDSDAGRSLSSLERLTVNPTVNQWPTQGENPQMRSGDVAAADCANCPKWKAKYGRAKQELNQLNEKLRASNLRKEKVDRAVIKQVGLSRATLTAARGILEQEDSSHH